MRILLESLPNYFHFCVFRLAWKIDTDFRGSPMKLATEKTVWGESLL